MVVDSGGGFLDAVQLGTNEFELLESLLLVEQVGPSVFQQSRDEIFVGLTRVGA